MMKPKPGDRIASSKESIIGTVDHIEESQYGTFVVLKDTKYTAGYRKGCPGPAQWYVELKDCIVI